MDHVHKTIKPTAAPIIGGLHPKIHLAPCRSCKGEGKRVINGVTWSCFVCSGSGTCVRHGGHAA